MDTRGVNNSGPSVNCFPQDPISGVSQNLFYTDVYRSVDNTTLEIGFAKSGAYGDWCSAALALNGTNVTAGYVNTNAVATDMLRYIEVLAKSQGSNPEEAKLWYYGISYGSILGMTYAAKYPNRIGRLMIDGIVDAEDYYFGTWETCLSDADEAVRTFYSFCFEAGPEACSFHKNASSVEELEERYWKLYDSIRKSPIEITDPSLGRPITITWEDLSVLMVQSSYAPHTQFQTLADSLATLEEGNATLIASMDNDVTDFIRSGYDDRELRTHTLCMDSNIRSEFDTIEKYTNRTNFLVNQSVYGGAWLNAWTGALCRNLKFAPPEVQTMKGMFTGRKLGGEG
jgi:pimeloyl-ACP methyl ester carboxylesterase